MYYRVAIRQNTSTSWQWKSTSISSLTALFQFLRRYDKLAQDRLRIFSSSSIEEMDEQLSHENNGSGSCSVTAAQFRQEHLMRAQPAIDAASSHAGSNGAYPLRESFSASKVAATAAERQTASRGDFWNLMALANS